MFVKLAPLPGESFWSQVPTHWLRDPRLRGLDKAVMAYLQTHEVGYRVTMEQIIAEMYEAKDSLYAAVARLRDLGYLERAQPRTEEGKFEAVDYTFGPAAFKATYTRNWGRRNDNSDVSAGQTASGLSGTGETGTGFSGAGEPDTKKNKRSKSTTLEDQNPSSSRTREAADPADPEEEEVSPSSKPEDPTGDDEVTPARILTEILAMTHVHKRIIGPQAAKLRALIGQELGKGWGAEQLAHAVADVGPLDTADSVFGALRYRLDNIGAPPPPRAARAATEPHPTKPKPAHCGYCHEQTRMITPDVLDIDAAPGQPAIPCPKCHPDTVRSAA